MGRKKRENRKSKKYVYFIVEGCTEENYIKLLKLLYKQDIQIKNCNGGSAKKVLEEAKKIIREGNNDYIGYVIWFDQDTYNKSKDYNLFNSLQSKNNVEIYISCPCIENWLLAHFDTINQNESECDQCIKKLQNKGKNGGYIPNYKKNDCNMLTKYIKKEEIKIAIDNYPDLGAIPQIVENNELFKKIKLLNDKN